MGKWELKQAFTDGCHGKEGYLQYLKVTVISCGLTDTTFPWYTSQFFREITGASQNAEDDGLFMGKQSQSFMLRSNLRQNLEG